MMDAAESSTPMTKEQKQDLWKTDILDAVLEHKWSSIHQYLHEADCVDEDNWTVLFWACREYYTPLDTIKLLINAYSPVVRHQDINGCIPLHIALEYGRTLDVIKSLVEVDKNILKIKDTKGRTPLHIACNKANNTPLQVLEYLVKECPEAGLHKDCMGNTPLTEAISNNVEDEVIELLLRYCPDCVSITHDKFHSPLHLAVNLNQSVRIIRALVKCEANLTLSINSRGQTAEDLFYFKYDYVLCKFLESIPSSSSPHTIWNGNRMINSSSVQRVFNIACFFLDQNSIPVKDELHNLQSTILQSAIKSPKCPWSFCELFLRLDPHQSLQHDLQIELIASSSKRKYYEPRLMQGAKAIRQLKLDLSNHKKCYGSERAVKIAKMKYLLGAMRSSNEELLKMNFLYSSMRENPTICANKKRRLN